MEQGRQLADAKDKIIRLLIDRVPNYVPWTVIRQRLPQTDEDTLQQAIQMLLEEQKIIPLATVANFRDRSYRMYDPTPYPVRTIIQVGDTQIPRLLSTTGVNEFPEIFNETVERVAENISGLEKRFGEMFEEQLRRYWATIVTLFGVFVSVLAFVLVSMPQVAIDPQLPWLQILVFRLAYALPLAVVLAIFVLVLRFVVR